jgi:hypothetical protein
MSDNNLILIVAIVVVIFLIVSINNKKNKKKYSTNSVNNCTENFDQYSTTAPAPAPYANLVYNPKSLDTYTTSSDLTAQAGEGYNLGVDSKDPRLDKYFKQAPPPKAPIISDDLLPKKNENWFETPSVGSKLDDANLLADAIFKVGVDTIGNTKKNPSYDIRGTIANPKFPISPWNNSSYEPDNNLRSLC